MMSWLPGASVRGDWTNRGLFWAPQLSGGLAAGGRDPLSSLCVFAAKSRGTPVDLELAHEVNETGSQCHEMVCREKIEVGLGALRCCPRLPLPTSDIGSISVWEDMKLLIMKPLIL